MSDEPCDHYDEQVAIRLIELKDEDDAYCYWCGEPANLVLVKSKRHTLALCDECRQLIKILASNGADSEGSGGDCRC